MRLTFTLSVLTILMAPAALAAALKPYGNARFNFWVQVPSDLIALPPPDNGDGQAWQSRNKDIQVRAWGSYGPNVLNLNSVRDYAAWDEKNIKENGGRVTYKRLLPAAFVLSGYLNDGRIFYQKTLIQQGTEASLLIQYPASQRTLWDKLCVQMAASLKWGSR